MEVWTTMTTYKRISQFPTGFCIGQINSKAGNLNWEEKQL